MSLTYTKLFHSITASSIWSEDSDTKVVWVTMLAMADQFGRIYASIPGVAKIAGVPIGATEGAIEKFLAPDKYSRTKESEGRRIEVIDGGWKLLNYALYRDLSYAEDRKEQVRLAQATFRKKRNSNQIVINSNQESSIVSPLDKDKEEDKEEKNKRVCANSPLGFNEFWDLYPKRKAKGAAEKAWKKISPTPELTVQIMKAVSDHSQLPEWKKENGQFIPLPATWLNGARWEDEVAVKKVDSFAEFVPHFKLNKNDNDNH